MINRRKFFDILTDMDSAYRYIKERTCGVILLAIMQLYSKVSVKFLTFVV